MSGSEAEASDFNSDDFNSTPSERSEDHYGNGVDGDDPYASDAGLAGVSEDADGHQARATPYPAEPRSSLDFKEYATGVDDDDLGGQLDGAASIGPEGEGEGDGDEDQLLPAPATADGAKRKKAYEAASCFSLDYYKRFFDVDTEQVMFRIRSSFWPFRNRFLAQIEGKGDLYGPFWISTTLIFAVAMAGNIVDWKESYTKGEQDAWKYDFNKVSFAATVVYVYITLIPFTLWAFFKYTMKAGTQPSLLDVVTVYGYSLFVYIPVSIICIIPWIGEEIDWTSLVAAMLTSGGVLLINFWSTAKASKKEGVLLFVAACHIGLTLLLKFFFFTYTKRHHLASTTSVGPNTTTPVHA